MEQNISITTLKQAEKLVKHGLDPDTADLHYWSGPVEPGSPYAKDAVVLQPYASAVEYSKYINTKNEVVPYVFKPLWSFNKLIWLMPKYIEVEGNKYYLRIDWNIREFNPEPIMEPSVDYVDKVNHTVGLSIPHINSPLTCLVNMVCTLLDKGFLNNYKVATTSAENNDQIEYVHQPEYDRSDRDD